MIPFPVRADDNIYYKEGRRLLDKINEIKENKI